MTRLLGWISDEPLHAPTTHFPMALYPMAVVFDLLAFAQDDGSLYTRAAFIVMLVATVMAGVAMLTGFLHLFRDVSPKANVWRIAILHMSVQLTAASLLIISLILRVGHVDEPHPSLIATALAVAGTVVLLAGGWLGGRMVYTYGVGVTQRASQKVSTRTDD